MSRIIINMIFSKLINVASDSEVAISAANESS